MRVWSNGWRRRKNRSLVSIRNFLQTENYGDWKDRKKRRPLNYTKPRKARWGQESGRRKTLSEHASRGRTEHRKRIQKDKRGNNLIAGGGRWFQNLAFREMGLLCGKWRITRLKCHQAGGGTRCLPSNDLEWEALKKPGREPSDAGTLEGNLSRFGEVVTFLHIWGEKTRQ